MSSILFIFFKVKKGKEESRDSQARSKEWLPYGTIFGHPRLEPEQVTSSASFPRLDYNLIVLVQNEAPLQVAVPRTKLICSPLASVSYLLVGTATLP